ncbi:MAG TPA: PTS alpha-glucoside transporter subunit IIBC [Lachnospiraceae bacterium]|nr:PTS alpha-glucoside transporter subunit IIBC [Lachnospiraceae bacterium]
MMQKIQKFGGAMFTPVLLFSFAGVMVGIGTLCTTEAVLGSLAAPTSMWYLIWNVILQGAWCVFNQLPLLFVVGLPIGLAKKQAGRCCMEALVLYLTFHYFVNTILTQWGSVFGVDFAAEVGGSSGLTMIANIKTLDMGMFGALLVSGLVIYLHNKFFDTELPEWLGSFNGSTFIFMIGFFVMLPVALLSVLIWPNIQHGMQIFQNFVMTSGSLGVWVFIFLERLLIPFGLHHLMYSPFYYDNLVCPGGIYSYWATQLPQLAASTASLKSLCPEAAFTATGFSKIFGCPGIALAFYATAKPEKKKQLKGLLIPITLTAIVCGVTEPIEFTFLFIAPVLFVVHAFLAACLSTTINLFGIVGVFSGGLIEMSSLNFIPLMTTHWKEYLLLLVIGLVYTGIYFVVFRFLILKFNFKTPGREDTEETKFYSKVEFRARKDGGVEMDKKTMLAALIMEGLGGADNIVDVTNCATRLRLNVKDETVVKDDAYFKSIGSHGISKNGKSMQVIVGMSVPSVREKFENIMANPSAYALDTGDEAVQHEIKAVANGEAMPVTDVPDEVFASKALGDGVAVIVTDGKVYSPADGEVSMIAETLHAYGISTDDGLELLVHIGINTVELEGKGFTPRVKEGDRVSAGQLLCEVDMKLMKEKGYQMHTPILMTNGDECEDVQLLSNKKAKAGQTTVITYKK